MTVWSGAHGGDARAEVWAFLQADDAELLPYDCEASRSTRGDSPLLGC